MHPKSNQQFFHPRKSRHTTITYAPRVKCVGMMKSDAFWDDRHYYMHVYVNFNINSCTFTKIAACFAKSSMILKFCVHISVRRVCRIGKDCDRNGDRMSKKDEKLPYLH